MPEHIITKPDEIEWVTIPTGEFIMGSDGAQDHHIKELDSEFPDEWLVREQPQREVYLSEYTIAKYTVTNRQFKAFVDETGYRTERANWMDSANRSGINCEKHRLRSDLTTPLYA